MTGPHAPAPNPILWKQALRFQLIHLPGFGVLLIPLTFQQNVEERKDLTSPLMTDWRGVGQARRTLTYDFWELPIFPLTTSVTLGKSLTNLLVQVAGLFFHLQKHLIHNTYIYRITCCITASKIMYMLSVSQWKSISLWKYLRYFFILP